MLRLEAVCDGHRKDAKLSDDPLARGQAFSFGQESRSNAKTPRFVLNGKAL
jgi:hypothetical protein